MEFNLIKLVGNKKSKTLTATILYKNIDPEKIVIPAKIVIIHANDRSMVGFNTNVPFVGLSLGDVSKSIL